MSKFYGSNRLSSPTVVYVPIYDAIDGHFMSAARSESVSSDTHVGILETKHVNSVKKKLDKTGTFFGNRNSLKNKATRLGTTIQSRELFCSSFEQLRTTAYLIKRLIKTTADRFAFGGVVEIQFGVTRFRRNGKPVAEPRFIASITAFNQRNHQQGTLRFPPPLGRTFA